MVRKGGRAALASGTLELRRRPVQARSLRRFKLIVEAAHRVLKDGGPNSLTTNAVAAEAGISIGSLYEYFPNKEAIILNLYEGKLEGLRQLTPPVGHYAPDRMGWRDFLDHFVRTLKAAEKEMDLDAALFDSVQNLPRLKEIELVHSEWIAGAFAAHLRRFGSTWSDAALFDLGMYLYAVDSATWYYWRRLEGRNDLAIARALVVGYAVIAPAMDGSPEPTDSLVRRKLPPPQEPRRDGS